MLFSFLKSLSGSPPFRIMSNFIYYSACQKDFLLGFQVCNLMMSHPYFTCFVDSPLPVDNVQPSLRGLHGPLWTGPAFIHATSRPPHPWGGLRSHEHIMLSLLVPQTGPSAEIPLPLLFLLPRLAFLKGSCGINHLRIVLRGWFVRSKVGAPESVFLIGDADAAGPMTTTWIAKA